MTRLIVITGFIIAFAAGMMAGVVIRPGGPRPNGPGPGGRESFIANQLSLTEEQQSQMKAIWQDVSRRPDRGKRFQIRQQQAEAVAKLIRPEEQAAYDAIVKEYQGKLDQMDADNKRAFQQAVEKTKSILTPEQLKKYEALLARNDGRDRDRPATRPNG